MSRHTGGAVCFLALALLAAASGACSAAYGAGHDSPWESRVEFRVSPKVAVAKSETVELRPTVAYERAFGYGFGGSNVFDGGAQVRFHPKTMGNRNPFAGAEGLYVVRFPGHFQSARIGGLFGVQIYESARATGHIYGATGISQQSAGTGYYLRVGVEINAKKK